MWLKDTKGEPSITATLLVMFSLLAIGLNIAHALGKVQSTSDSISLVVTFTLLYLGRRTSMKLGAVQIEDKEKSNEQ